jgi:hypothetical protein
MYLISIYSRCDCHAVHPVLRFASSPKESLCNCNAMHSQVTVFNGILCTT